MKEKQMAISQIPPDIIQDLSVSPCKTCGDQSDVFGVFHPDSPKQWLGYVAILYPFCSSCVEKYGPDAVELILDGELEFAKACGNKEPFIGMK